MHSKVCRMPTVTGDRHVSADEGVRLHEAEWYRESLAFVSAAGLLRSGSFFLLEDVKDAPAAGGVSRERDIPSFERNV